MVTLRLQHNGFVWIMEICLVRVVVGWVGLKGVIREGHLMDIRCESVNERGWIYV